MLYFKGFDNKIKKNVKLGIVKKNIIVYNYFRI